MTSDSPLSAQVRQGAAAAETSDDEVLELVVYYTAPGRFHTPPEASWKTCTSFDELLDLLESDTIDTLMFDPSVSHDEVSYITRWARLFRPAVRIVTVLEPKAAFFSSQRI